MAKIADSSRLVLIWNSFAGVVPFDELKPVKKFMDRATGVNRIWKAIQRLEVPVAEQAAPAAPKRKSAKPNARQKGVAPNAPRTARKAKPEGEAGAPRESSKKAVILELLRQDGGATLAEIAASTGWQNHSIRGFVSGHITKKMGLAVSSAKHAEGLRRYQIA